jgi:hypothetical protein
VEPALLSYRRADRLLGARNGTTSTLVAAGRLKGVPWRAGWRVLREDVLRVASEGLAPDLRRPRAPRRKPPRGDVAAAIMRIRITPDEE